MTNLLEIEDLQVTYASDRGTLHAVDGVDLSVPAGGIVGLVGESGSGKSTLAKAIVGLAPITRGWVRFRGADVIATRGGALKQMRKDVQMVFQDPYSSLNPRATIGEAIEEPLLEHFRLTRAQRRAEVARLLDLVGLSSDHSGRYPFQFSGGQRQRIAIARALAVRPQLLVADEITSALDVSVQSTILNLLRELQRATGVACLFISHNLAVVRYLSREIAVMHLGKVVEVGPARDLFARPSHPYTKVLIDSVPRLHRRDGRLVAVEGDLADPHEPPPGCRFHTRCPVGPATHSERGICRLEDPHPSAERHTHRAACHFAPAVHKPHE